MLNTVKAGLLVCCFIAASVASAAGLTNKSVEAVLAQIDNAANTLDANAVASVMSDDVSITMNISMQGKSQVLKPSKQEYIAMLQQGWAMYQDYKYKRSNVKIDLQGNKAVVSADVSESMTVQGQTLAGVSKETVTIEVINGKPMVTRIVGHTSM